jgi:hypothetical protein
MKIYWINWISLNRKVNTEFGAVGRTDQEICRKAGQLADKLDKLSEKQDKLAENEKLLKNRKRLTLISKKFRKNLKI